MCTQYPLLYIVLVREAYPGTRVVTAHLTAHTTQPHTHVCLSTLVSGASGRSGVAHPFAVCVSRFAIETGIKIISVFTKASNKKAVPKVAPDILFTNSVFRSEIPHGLIAAA